MIMTWLPTTITVVVYLVTFAVAWGKFTSKIAEIEKEVDNIKDTRVHNEKCKSIMDNVNIQLKDMKALDIASRFTRLETMLEMILKQLHKLEETK